MVRIFLGIDKVDIVVPLDNKEKYRQVSEANDTVERYVVLYKGTAPLCILQVTDRVGATALSPKRKS